MFISKWKNWLKKKILEEKTENIKVHADKSRMKQVLINVLNNSLKFTDKGSISITIGEASNKAYILMKDTGIGIQKDKTQYVFNKFFTANEYGNATTGAGLGLNIVKNIIDMHGGSIELKSEEGKGTTIKIIL